MRRSVMLAAIGLLVVGGSVVLATRGGDPEPTVDSARPRLETRMASAGEVDVTIEPSQLDDRGAAFTITLDTHSVELSADLTAATLAVDGTAWPVEEWSGDGPGGHHREGELRFAPAGPATRTAILTIPGLPEAVEATWELGS